MDDEVVEYGMNGNDIVVKDNYYIPNVTNPYIETNQGDIDALLIQLSQKIQQGEIQQGNIPAPIDPSFQQVQSQESIPDHRQKWTELRNTILCQYTRQCDVVSSSQIIQNHVQSFEHWQMMLGRASEMQNQAQRDFNVQCSHITNTKAINDVSRIQSDRCKEVLEHALFLIRQKQEFEDIMCELNRRDDVSMLRTSKIAVEKLNEKYDQERKQVVERIEKTKKDRDAEFAPREKSIIERLTALKTQCKTILDNYGSFLKDIGPPLQSVANETIQALQTIQSFDNDLKVLPPMEHHVLGQIQMLFKAIQDMQTQIDQLEKGTVADPDDKTPHVDPEELGKRVFMLKNDIDQCNKSLFEMKQKYSEIVKAELALFNGASNYQQSAHMEPNSSKGNLIEGGLKTKIEFDEKHIQNLKEQLLALQLQYDSQLLEQKKYLARKVKEGHPKWVKILELLSKSAIQLTSDIEVYYQDKQRTYDTIIHDLRVHMEDMQKRKKEAIFQTIMKLQEQLIMHIDQRQKQWSVANHNLTFEIGRLINEATTLINYLAISDIALATVTVECKKAFARLSIEMDRIQALREYIHVLEHFKQYI